MEMCPFCGEEIEIKSDEFTGFWFFHLCSIKGEYMVKIESRLFSTKEEAIEAWNRRVKK